MSQLKRIREQQNLTQQELSERSQVSVRTIQRIESGTEPKGHTLKMLARTLDVKEEQLLERNEDVNQIKPGLLKIINLSSLPFTLLPPLNIILPLIIMFAKKEFNPLTRQIVSVQIFWTICAGIIFMLSAFMKNWFSLGSDLVLGVMIFLVLSNFYIILRNSAEIDKKQKLRIRLGFNII